MCRRRTYASSHTRRQFTCFNDTDEFKFDIDLVEEATIRAQTSVSGPQQQFVVVFTHDEAECAGYTNTSVVTAYTVNFQGQQWLLSDAAILISQFDAAATAVFLAMCIYLAVNIRRASAAANAEVVTVADYAVRVTGLPPRTTKADIRRHFDNLYNPTRRSWYTPGYCFGCYRSHRSREAPVVIDRTFCRQRGSAMFLWARGNGPDVARRTRVLVSGYSEGGVHVQSDPS